MPNIINPNCLSLPQQVEKNKQDILKLFASNLEELSGLEFNPTSLVYEQNKAIVSGKFIVSRDESEIEIDGVVTLPITSGDGIVVDASEDNTKIVIALDNEDRELLNFVEELISQIDENNNIVFTSDMENYVTTNFSKKDGSNIVVDNSSWKNKLGYQNIDLLYDSKSTDPNINLGYTGGLNNGVSINIDTNKYKKVILYSEVWNEQFNTTCTAIIDFNVCLGASNVVDFFITGDQCYFDSRGGYVNSDKTNFTAYCKRMYGTNKFNSGLINKIEGVY